MSSISGSGGKPANYRRSGSRTYDSERAADVGRTADNAKFFLSSYYQIAIWQDRL
jgi:hypothetical protein